MSYNKKAEIIFGLALIVIVMAVLALITVGYTFPHIMIGNFKVF